MERATARSAAAPEGGARAAPRASEADRAAWLARLALTDFRSYKAARLEVDHRPVALTGANGAGKTNLLEAISFLAPGRGLRAARLDEVARRAASENASRAWSVAARVVTSGGPRDLGTGLEAEAADASAAHAGEGRERRVVKVDGAPARGQQALAEVLHLVWLTPQMDGLFREGPGARRRFIDRLASAFDSGHAGRLAAYEQALRQRARLLREGGGDNAWLNALEDTLARHGVAVAAARGVLVGALSRACAQGVGPFPRARLAIDGEVDAWLRDGPALSAEDELRARLATSRSRDAESGGASLGPHRSDLTVSDRDSGRPAAEGSTGEQKALLLSIVLAHARLAARERGSAPVLLLDEVVAHLDRHRRRALFDEILALRAQAWLTGTEPGLFGELADAAQHFVVEDSRITPLG